MSKVEQMKMTKVQYRAVKDLAVRMSANYDGRSFVPAANLAKYFPECAKVERRKKEAARLRRLRAV